MVVNSRHMLGYGAGLVGLTDRFDTGRVPVVLQDAHVLGALLIVVCSMFAVARLLEGIVRGPRGDNATRPEVGRFWLEDVLVPRWRVRR